MSGPNDELVTLRSDDGRVTQVPLSQAGEYLRAGFTEETPAEQAARQDQAAREAQISPIESFGQSLGRTASLGLTDAAQRAVGGQGAAQYLRDAQTAHPTADTAGMVTGIVAPALLTGGESVAASIAAASPIGRAAALGSTIAKLGEGGGGVLRSIGAKALGGAAEGALIGGGQGVSELAMSSDPITFEHAVSTISSNALFGGAIGGGAGLVGGTLESGLGKAKGLVDDAVAARTAQPAVDADLAELDMKGLTKAKQAELDTIEAQRVPQRQQL